jgi:hypothetical protein
VTTLVKKYPFSNKAVKAMIAATIVFTPVATTGLFGADKAEAAHQDTSHFSSVTAFDAYAREVSESVAEDATLVSSLQGINWVNVLAPVFETGASADQKTAVAALVQLQVSFYTGTYNSPSVLDFIDNNKDQLGNFSDQTYIDYLEAVELNVHNNITTINTNYTYQLFNTLLNATRNADTTTNGVGSEVSEVLVITDEKMRQVVSNIEAELGNDGINREQLKSAMMTAGAAWLTKYGADHNTGGGGSGGGSGGSSGGSGGGTVTSPPTSGGDVVVSPDVKENGTKVTATISSALSTKILNAVTAQTGEIVIKVPAPTKAGQIVSLDIPASLIDSIEAKAPAADIVIEGNGASYTLPVAEIDTTTIAADLGTTAANLSLRVSINPISAEQATAATAALQEHGIDVVTSIVDITLEAVVGDKVSPIRSLGNVYVERSFELNGTVDTNNATGVVLEADGSYRALPTKFITVDGKQHAIVSSLTNSIYTVVESDVTFPDIDNGKNWAEDYIETLASKHIISGSTAGTYKPDDYMTRAQFALLLSRSLGLPSVEYDNRFKDVKGDEWFNVNGALMAAVQSGIVAGKVNGTFAPNDHITRAEAGAMIGRALDLDFINFDNSQLNTAKKLADFTDAKSIGASTRTDVLKVYQAGIMSGASNGTFQPNEFTKRDQMARILAEFLIKADLMEDIK